MRPLHCLCAGLIGAILSAAAPAALAIQAPQGGLFSAAFGTSDLNGGPGIPRDADYQFNDTQAIVTSPTDPEYLGAIYRSTGQTGFGINRASSDIEFGDPRASASLGFSAWVDRFVVTGGTGTVQAQLSVTLTGSIGPWNQSQAGYLLFSVDESTFSTLTADLAQQTSDRILDYVPIVVNAAPAFVPVMVGSITSADYADATDVVPFSFTYTATLDVVYDQPFYLVSSLGTLASEDGYLDISSTAIFGITVPTGAVVVTGSGTGYPPAVPEPGTWAMIGAGLTLLAVAGRRRRAN